MHIEPGASFVAGGLYQPEANVLKQIRAKIAEDDTFLRAFMNENEIKKHFHWVDDQVKTAPKGYPKDHPAIDLIKFKSFAISKNYSDEQVSDEDFFLSKITEDFQHISKLNHYLNEIVHETKTLV